MHLEQLQIIKSKVTEKKATANMKHNELVQSNKNVVEMIRKNLLCNGLIDEDVGVCKDHVKLCSLKIFSG